MAIAGNLLRNLLGGEMVGDGGYYFAISDLIDMKFTGEIHGGNKEDENAFFIDRAIIVRK